MQSFEFESMDEAYPVLVKALLEQGADVSPRGMLTKEISPVGITITNPRKRVISNPTRKLNYGFMVGELLWMLQGKNDLSITHYNKQWEKFSDDGETLNGAYGQRIFRWDGLYDIYEEFATDEDGNTQPTIACDHIVINQFESAYEQLKKDPDTRQATVMLFNPVQDYRETKDKPCTNLLRFTIRDGKLNMMVVMRSNDIIKGTPYDIFNFTMMQELMAGKLDVELGKYTHVVDSLHLYEDDFELARKIIEDSNISIYDNFNLNDARISSDVLDEEMMTIYSVEALTRLQSEVIKVEKVEELLYKIKNLYWRSLAAVIATYNFRKAGRSQEELEILKNYITNEFSCIDSVQNWKTLNKA